MTNPTLIDLFTAPTFAVEVAMIRAPGAELLAEARCYAGSFAAYPAGTGVLIALADASAALSVAAGSWWAGQRVAFARPDSPYDLAVQAEAVNAAIVVTDSNREGWRADPVSWPHRCRASDDALDVMSSGTTGAPKVVVFSHAGLVANARALATSMSIGPVDRLWTPLHHGLPGVLCTVVFAAASSGACAVLSRPGDPIAASREMGEAAPTVVYAVPEMYEALVRGQRGGPGGVRWWLSSSAPLSGPLFERMLDRFGATVRSFYCGSEVGTVTFNAGPDVAAVRDGVGRPLPGVMVRVDSNGRLVVGGALTGRGYRHGATVAAFPRGGFITGDLGRMTDDGGLRVIGREDDRVHVGADVVDPQVVEAHIRALAGVDDCLVVARPHSRLGNVLEARVVRAPGSAADERDVILGCRARGLTGSWVPRAVVWITEVPRTRAGKPDRREAATS